MQPWCLRRGELLRGPLYYVLIMAAVTVTYWRESATGLLVIALMCGGDGLADIVGRRFGAAKLPHNHNKSWAGSLAMFLGAPPPHLHQHTFDCRCRVIDEAATMYLQGPSGQQKGQLLLLTSHSS